MTPMFVGRTELCWYTHCILFLFGHHTASRYGTYKVWNHQMREREIQGGPLGFPASATSHKPIKQEYWVTVAYLGSLHSHCTWCCLDRLETLCNYKDWQQPETVHFQLRLYCVNKLPELLPWKENTTFCFIISNFVEENWLFPSSFQGIKLNPFVP